MQKLKNSRINKEDGIESHNLPEFIVFPMENFIDKGRLLREKDKKLLLCLKQPYGIILS